MMPDPAGNANRIKRLRHAIAAPCYTLRRHVRVQSLPGHPARPGRAGARGPRDRGAGDPRAHRPHRRGIRPRGAHHSRAPRPRDRERHRQVRSRRAQDRLHHGEHRHARLLRAPRRGEPWRPRHGHAQRRLDRALQLRRKRGDPRPSSRCSSGAARSSIALTGNPQSTLAREADVHLDAGAAKEACPLNLAPTASTTAALALGDALAVALMRSAGLQPRGFRALAPRRHAWPASCSPTCATSCARESDMPRRGRVGDAGRCAARDLRGAVGITAVVDAARARGRASSPTATCGAPCRRASTCAPRGSPT